MPACRRNDPELLVMSPLMTLHPSAVERCQDGSRLVCSAHPLLGSCDYSHAEVQQRTRTAADTGDAAHAPGATLAGVPGQRFCPDTEEVTGSNPVSPTSNIPWSDSVCDSLDRLLFAAS